MSGKIYSLLFYVCEYSACMCVSALCMHLETAEAKREYWTPWSYGWFQTTICVLKTEPGPSASVPRALAAGPALQSLCYYSKLCLYMCVYHVSADAFGEQRRASDHLELELLPVTMSCPAGIQTYFSASAVCAVALSHLSSPGKQCFTVAS